MTMKPLSEPRLGDWHPIANIGFGEYKLCVGFSTDKEQNMSGPENGPKEGEGDHETRDTGEPGSSGGNDFPVSTRVDLEDLGITIDPDAEIQPR